MVEPKDAKARLRRGARAYRLRPDTEHAKFWPAAGQLRMGGNLPAEDTLAGSVNPYTESVGALVRESWVPSHQNF